MAIKVADNFLYQGRKPLDNRILIDTVADMVAMAPAIIYDGMIAYVKDTKEFYVYDSTNTSDPVLDKWRLFSDRQPALKEYIQNTKYKKDDLVYLDENIARVASDYTSDNTMTIIEDSFKLDTTNNKLIPVSASSEFKIYKSNVTLNNIIEGTTTLSFTDLITSGITINDLETNQFIFDEEGTVARIKLIDTTTGNIETETITISTSEYSIFISTVDLDTTISNTTTLSFTDIATPMGTTIEDLERNFIVYDSKGTIGKIETINTTTNSFAVVTMTTADNPNHMPIAPDTKELKIKNGGVGYTVGDIIETSTTGTFAEVTSIGTSGVITGVSLSNSTAQSTTGTGAIIDYAQVVYGGFGANWAALSEAAVLVAQVLADRFDYEQGYSFEITAPGAGYAIGDVIPTNISGVNVRVTNVDASGDILEVQYCRQINVNISGTNGKITATPDTNIFIIPEQYWNAGLSLFDITNDDGANVQFYRTGDTLVKYSAGANNKIYEFTFDEVNGVITQKSIEISGSGTSMKEHKTTKLLDKTIESITTINITDIVPITQIADIQTEQLIYDEDGTIGKVTSIDATTGNIEVRTITLSGTNNEYMPIAPDTKGLKIKTTGSGYNVGEVIESTTPGIFAEITGVDSLGAITNVSLSTATSATTTNTTGIISYEQIIYGGYKNNWAPLVDAAILNAKISADTGAYDTGYDYTITNGGSGYSIGDIVATDTTDVNVEVVAVDSTGAITSVKFTRKAIISTSGTGSTINATVNPDIQVIPNDLWNGGVSIFSLTNDDGATVEFYRTGDVTTKYGIGAGNKLYKFEYDEIDGIIKQSSSVISGIAQISNKSDNAIEEITGSTDPNEDGLYVKDLQPQIDSIKKYQKYLNTELEYCDANIIETETLNYTLASCPVTLKYNSINSNMDYDNTTGKFTLKAGKRYEIIISARVGSNKLVSGNAVGFQASFNVFAGSNFFGNFVSVTGASTHNWSGKDFVKIVKFDEDTDIFVTLDQISGGVSNAIMSSLQLSLTIKEVGQMVEIDPVNYVDTTQGIEDTPVGHIISTMSNTAPKHYLICDGTEYNIVDYPHLAEHFKTEFGSYNYFGGDGTTTFAVPDLRGEFLRGTGTNSHANQGSGSAVGEHQDATDNLNFFIGAASEIWIDSNSNKTVKNADSKNTFDTSIARRNFYRRDNVSNDNITYGDNGTYYTSRPTNTSVLYCIKYEPTYFMYLNGYEEVKELINTTYEYATPASSGTTVYTDTISLSESIESFDKLEFVIDIRSADLREFYKKVDIFRVSDIVYTTSGIVGENTYQAEIHTITNEGTWIANICFNFRDNSTIDIVRVGVSSPIDTSAPWDFIKIHNIRGIRNSTTQSTNSNDPAKLNTYSTIITGNDTDSTFTINHNLDTLKLSTSVYDITTLEEVAYELKRIDKNTVQISWGDPIPTGTEYQVDILGW